MNKSLKEKKIIISRKMNPNGPKLILTPKTKARIEIPRGMNPKQVA